jgi:hypothetical protein
VALGGRAVAQAVGHERPAAPARPEGYLVGQGQDLTGGRVPHVVRAVVGVLEEDEAAAGLGEREGVALRQATGAHDRFARAAGGMPLPSVQGRVNPRRPDEEPAVAAVPLVVGVLERAGGDHGVEGPGHASEPAQRLGRQTGEDVLHDFLRQWAATWGAFLDLDPLGDIRGVNGGERPCVRRG